MRMERGQRRPRGESTDIVVYHEDFHPILEH